MKAVTGQGDVAVPPDLEARCINELAAAFRAWESRIPGLRIDVVGHVAGSLELVHPVAGFHVRMAPAGGAGVSLYVSAAYAELVRWKSASGALRERFDVSLDEFGYGWGGSVFATAAELAHDLVAYMQYSLDSIRKQ
jgi:hypothetical protein